MAPTTITLSHLPYEIRQKIFTYFVTIPWSIIFDGSFRAYYGHAKRDVDKILAIAEIFLSGPRLFYEDNEFYLSEALILSFLAYKFPYPLQAEPQRHRTI